MLINQNYRFKFESKARNQSQKLEKPHNKPLQCPYKSVYNDINLNKNNAGIFFSGLEARVPHVVGDLVITRDPINKTGEYQCDTFFFRDAGTLEIMKGYLEKNFPEGTHIADFGCSDGEETYTIAMLLDDINEDGRYKITGYDPCMMRVDEADIGEYYIGFNEDGFLNAEDKDLTPYGQKLKTIFNQFFTREQESDYGAEKAYSVNEDKAENVNFDLGNINQVDEVLENERTEGNETGVVVFKNAWYHITQVKPGDRYLPDEYDDLSDLKNVLTKIHASLPKNGILVTGSLPRDHILGEYAFEKGVVVNSPFHKALKECGFEPLEESAVKVPSHKGEFDVMLYRNTYVYSIWKKVNTPEL